jgi:hypothetical protein
MWAIYHPGSDKTDRLNWGIRFYQETTTSKSEAHGLRTVNCRPGKVGAILFAGETDCTLLLVLTFTLHTTSPIW